IGVAEPVSVNVNTFGTGKVPDERIVELVRQVFPLKPAAIIRVLDLQRPIYQKTAAFGHFGRDSFPWERLDKVAQLRKLAGL
ncbi:MAG TPA: methionine adenosyltransferase domain-containing protein, partial [Candidatus Aminicenantes bacterium]|nr:methionine adenosyltransferase domain-containing protein [Candidatus Aminicenantes bacterium]